MKDWIAVALVTLAGLAIVGAWALAQVAPEQSGTAAAIALTGAAVTFAGLVWLGRRKS